MASAEITECSSSLHELVLNLYALLENLLEWAQFQKGLIGFMPKALCLSDIFSQCIDSTKQRACKRVLPYSMKSPRLRKFMQMKK
jgi:K+-sensing histidine kinase KdpD